MSKQKTPRPAGTYRYISRWVPDRREAVLIIYMFIHLTWYFLDEYFIQADHPGLHIMYCPLDDKIPFCEWFIFPYLGWFLYMAIPGIWFYLHEKPVFEKYVLTLECGWFVCMFINTVYPNGQLLRPETYPDNIAVWLVKLIQTADTPTNVFPSMHIVGALGVAVALLKSGKLRRRLGLQIFSILLCIAICLATMFLKQHSALDVMGATVVFVATYFFVYHGPASKLLTWLADVFLKNCELDRLCAYREEHPMKRSSNA
jgi:membrane-associated phospholipid phosphatase